ncbi:MAG TPA: alpha-ketoacid dehydrogenase subunit beta [Terriglobia bacterium]|nr:alpha-ketoacid dehydrogenase subunit beta [Terriglobia bacterium]
MSLPETQTPKTETSARRMTMVEALREALREEMRRDERVILIGEDIGVEGGFGGAFTVTLGLAEEFGHRRVMDTPISEAAIAGVSAGAAVGGLRPVADVQYGDFLFIAMDQLVNQAAKLRYMSGGKISVPMVMRAPVGATTRGAQHGQSLEGFFMHVPGLKVACPSNPYDGKGLLKTAIRDDNPVIFFEHKLLYGSKGARKEAGGIEVLGYVPEEEYLIPFGQAKIARPGRDVTMVANLLMVHRSLAAAAVLVETGIEAEVIDVRTLVPFDWDTVAESARRTRKVLIIEEDNLTGGWGAEVAARVGESCFGYLDAPIRRIAAPDTPVPFAPVMEKFYVPSVENIVAIARELVSSY